MAEDIVPAVAPVIDAAAPVTPAPVVSKDAPAPVAVSDKPAADKVAEFVAKKSTLLGDENPAEPAEGEGKKEEGDAVKPEAGKTVPEKYDVKAPEGMQIDTGLLDSVTPIFKELGITQEGAQKLVDAYAPYVKQASQAQHDAAMKSFDDQVESWGKETKSMLGPDAAKAMAPAARLINTFAGKEAAAFRQLLNDTGLGNHPVMVRFLINAGKSISQDSFVDGGNQVTDDTPDAAKSRMYPTMNKK